MIKCNLIEKLVAIEDGFYGEYGEFTIPTNMPFVREENMYIDTGKILNKNNVFVSNKITTKKSISILVPRYLMECDSVSIEHRHNYRYTKGTVFIATCLNNNINNIKIIGKE